MGAQIFVYIIGAVAYNHVQNTPLVEIWAKSCVQAAEQDLLVAYPVIDICDLPKSCPKISETSAIWISDIFENNLGIKCVLKKIF